jgi:copper chaperone NosL
LVIVTHSTAAQIVSPGEEPRFFDEIGCLRDYLSTRPALPAADTMIYVADHQSGAWVDAERALFTRTAASTAMATGLLAHADAASRDADPAARGGTPMSSQEIFGRALRSAAP